MDDIVLWDKAHALLHGRQVELTSNPTISSN